MVDIPRLGTKENAIYVRDVKQIAITPLGIEYLLDNNMMAKAYKVLKDMAAILPWK
ncbi:MAG: hypothetical protein GXZ11_03110 [Tissierellia bacterium]|nr:hypothetical protein [Tissierellia bacterium]